MVRVVIWTVKTKTAAPKAREKNASIFMFTKHASKTKRETMFKTTRNYKIDTKTAQLARLYKTQHKHIADVLSNNQAQ